MPDNAISPSGEAASALPTNPDFDPYALLSRPTLELSDAEVGAIVKHLREKRVAYVDSNGKAADRRKAPKAPAAPLTEEKKADNTSLIAALLATKSE